MFWQSRQNSWVFMWRPYASQLQDKLVHRRLIVRPTRYGTTIRTYCENDFAGSQLSEIKLEWRYPWRTAYQMETVTAGVTSFRQFLDGQMLQTGSFWWTQNCHSAWVLNASDLGYGSIFYLHLINQDDQVHCSFVCGKSRVGPLRHITFPTGWKR